MLWVRTRGWRDQFGRDQALRCRSISAVLAVLPNGLDDRDASVSACIGTGKTTSFFIRSAKAKGSLVFQRFVFNR